VDRDAWRRLCAEHGGVVVAKGASSSNTASPLSSQTMASPSIKQERTGSAATADQTVHS
jgi:hypothetical protein